MTIRQHLKRIAQRFGYDIIRFNSRSSPLARRIKLFEYFKIGCVFDIGASTGGYASELRASGYRKRIISFEPSSDAFQVLKSQAQGDAYWEVYQLVLGKKPGVTSLNLSRNRESSSMLRLKSRHIEVYPESVYIGQETVKVDTLDRITDQFPEISEPTFLKIDTQGYELQVLQGGVGTISNMTGIQVELSLVEMYENETPYMKIISFLESLGFCLMSFQPVIDDPTTGQLLQIDGLFFRNP